MTTIQKPIAQKKLVFAWLLLSLFTSILFILVCWSRTSDSTFGEVIQWLFNYLSPGLTLIIGSYAYTANQQEATPVKFISTDYFRITAWVSVIYLLTLITITITIPVTIGEDTLLLNHLKKFNIILSFLQTSVLVLLGIFFTKENKSS